MLKQISQKKNKKKLRKLGTDGFCNRNRVKVNLYICQVNYEKCPHNWLEYTTIHISELIFGATTVTGSRVNFFVSRVNI